MLHPEATPRQSYVEECFAGRTGPVVAATDYVKAFAEQIREVVPSTYRVLGTDGYGRSDSREKLREFFEVNRYYIVVAALKALADEGVLKPAEVSKAIKKFNIDSNKTDPVLL
jgi:pyruvate dehydrogenase E1 component